MRGEGRKEEDEKGVRGHKESERIEYDESYEEKERERGRESWADEIEDGEGVRETLSEGNTSVK